jgi:hypothetical protein
MSVSSTPSNIAASGNKPAIDNTRLSSSLRGNPSRTKPRDLNKTIIAN